jgi:hypothetical protein
VRNREAPFLEVDEERRMVSDKARVDQNSKLKYGSNGSNCPELGRAGKAVDI